MEESIRTGLKKLSQGYPRCFGNFSTLCNPTVLELEITLTCGVIGLCVAYQNYWRTLNGPSQLSPSEWAILKLKENPYPKEG